MPKIVFAQVVRRKGRRISVLVFHSRGCKHALSCQALPLQLSKRSVKKLEVGGEVCFLFKACRQDVSSNLERIHAASACACSSGCARARPDNLTRLGLDCLCLSSFWGLLLGPVLGPVFGFIFGPVLGASFGPC